MKVQNEASKAGLPERIHHVCLLLDQPFFLLLNWQYLRWGIFEIVVGVIFYFVWKYIKIIYFIFLKIFLIHHVSSKKIKKIKFFLNSGCTAGEKILSGHCFKVSLEPNSSLVNMPDHLCVCHAAAVYHVSKAWMIIRRLRI
jgi:hypothetical protein